MEIARSDSELRTAIKHTEHNKGVRERMLQEPSILMDAKRFEFLSRYTENLSATALLLRAIQDPTTCTTQELIATIIERPEVVICVRNFAMGPRPDHYKLLEEIQDITVKAVYSQVD